MIHFREREPGDPGPGDVLVNVTAAAINPIDWKLREGQMKWIYPLKFPVTPGFDFCGTVAAIGKAVSNVRPGDRICGMSNRRAGAAMAEQCLCAAKAIALVPKGLSDEEAAGLPLAGLTALQGLRDRGQLHAGMRVMVTGASGGVGHLAVQVARRRGCRVAAVCGPDNREWVEGLGAEEVLNYREPDWLRRAGVFDLIYDAVGTIGFGRARPHLRTGGSYVTTLPGPAIWLDQFIRASIYRRRARTFLVKPSGVDLAELLRACKAAKLRIRVDRSYDWKNFAEAFAHSEGGHARGKVVLTLGAPDASRT